MKKVFPSVSVLVLNYNGETILPACVESLLQTQYSGKLEIVVIDNASSDNSLVKLQPYQSQIQIICHEKNLGFAQAYNRVIPTRNSECIVFLNNDVIVEPQWLTALFQTYKTHNNVGAVSATLLRFDSQLIQVQNAGLTVFPNGHCRDRGTTFSLTQGTSYELYEGYYQKDKQVDAVSGGALFMKRDVFLKCGGFDERYFLYYEDVALSMNLRSRGFTLWNSGSSQVWHHHAYSSEENSHFFIFHSERGHLLFVSQYADWPTILTGWAEHLALFFIATLRILTQSKRRLFWYNRAKIRGLVLLSVFTHLPLVLWQRFGQQRLPWSDATKYSFSHV